MHCPPCPRAAMRTNPILPEMASRLFCETTREICYVSRRVVSTGVVYTQLPLFLVETHAMTATEQCF